MGFLCWVGGRKPLAELSAVVRGWVVPQGPGAKNLSWGSWEGPQSNGGVRLGVGTSRDMGPKGASKSLETEKQKGLPWLSSVKNPSCNAGDTGSVPGWGTNISHAVEQLNLLQPVSLHVTINKVKKKKRNKKKGHPLMLKSLNFEIWWRLIIDNLLLQTYLVLGTDLSILWVLNSVVLKLFCWLKKFWDPPTIFYFCGLYLVVWCLITDSLGEKSWFVVFANSHGINSSTVAHFKIPQEITQCELGRDVHSQQVPVQSQASASRLQHTTGVFTDNGLL